MNKLTDLGEQYADNLFRQYDMLSYAEKKVFEKGLNIGMSGAYDRIAQEGLMTFFRKIEALKKEESYNRNR